MLRKKSSYYLMNIDMSPQKSIQGHEKSTSILKKKLLQTHNKLLEQLDLCKQKQQQIISLQQQNQYIKDTFQQKQKLNFYMNKKNQYAKQLSTMAKNYRQLIVLYKKNEEDKINREKQYNKLSKQNQHLKKLNSELINQNNQLKREKSHLHTQFMQIKDKKIELENQLDTFKLSQKQLIKQIKCLQYKIYNNIQKNENRDKFEPMIQKKFSQQNIQLQKLITPKKKNTTCHVFEDKSQKQYKSKSNIRRIMQQINKSDLLNSTKEVKNKKKHDDNQQIFDQFKKYSLLD